MINIIKKNKFIFVSCFFLLLLTSCSDEVLDEIRRVINADFGSYTKSDPLIIIAMPFKPEDRFDGESRIGKMAWDGAVSGLIGIELFSDGKIIYRGIASDYSDYLEVLRRDSFWNDLGSGSQSVRHTLKRTATNYRANSVVYGLYEGDDSSLNLTVFFYAKVDDIILRERTAIEVEFMELKRLVDASENNITLTPSQKALRNMIREKTRVATVSLVRKYTEGRGR